VGEEGGAAAMEGERVAATAEKKQCAVEELAAMRNEEQT